MSVAATAPVLTLTRTSGQFAFHIAAAVANANNYQLQQDTVNTFTNPVVYNLGTAPLTGSRYNVTGLTTGTTYYFRIRAEKTTAPTSNSNWSSTVSNVFATVPDAVSSITPTPGNVSVSLAYTAPSNGGSAITGYKVERSLDNSTWTQVIASTTTNPYNVTSLTNGTLYYFRLTAINALGSGSSSTAVSATPRTIPGAPTGLTATTPVAGQQVTLTWVAPTGVAGTGGNPVNGYIIQGTTTSNANWTTIVANTGTTSVSYTATTFNGTTPLSNGTLYYFRVAAINDAGTGTYTSQVSATPKTTPSVPQNVTITSLNKQALITWSAPASTGGSAITGYFIEGSLDGNTWTTAIANPTAAATSSTVTSYNNSTALVNGNTYYFRISAVNVAGSGTASSTLTTIPQVRTFYFSPSGSSSNDGFSQSTPKVLLSQAVFGDGDTAYLMDGTHTYSSAVTITKAVTLTSLNGASSTELVFTSAVTGGCLNLQGDASGYSITNLTITSQQTSSSTLISIGFASSGSTNVTTWPTSVTVSGCKLKIGKYGFALKGENLTINNNTFERYSGSTGSQSVFLVYFTRGTLNITNNTWTDSVYPSRFIYFTGAGTAGSTYLNKVNSKTGTMNITNNTLNLTTPNPTARTVLFIIQDAFNTYSSTEANAGGLSSSDVSSFRLLWDISNNSVNHVGEPAGTTLKVLVPYIGAANDGQGGELLAQWGSVSMTNNTFNTTGTANADRGLLQIDPAVSITISETLYNSSRFTFRNNIITQPSPFVANAAVDGNRLLTTTKSTISQTNLYTSAWVSPQLASAPTITSITPSDGALSVQFTAPNNTGGYIETYEYSTDAGSNWTTSASLTSPISITGLTNGTSYQVQLRAKNDAGRGSPSGIVSGTPIVPNGGGAGDPYIKTLAGELYKLPSFNGFLRLYQGEVNGKILTVNAQTRIDDNVEGMNADTLSANKRLLNPVSENKLLMTSPMSFFERVYIQHGDVDMVVNIMDGFHIEKDGFNVERVGNVQKYLAGWKIYEHLNGDIYNIWVTSEVSIRIGIIPIKSIRNSVEIIGVSGGNGAIVNKLSLKAMSLKKLTDKKEVEKKDYAIRRHIPEVFVCNEKKHSINIPYIG